MENNKLLNTLQSHLDRNSEIMQIPRDSRYFDLRKEKGSIGASEISSLFPAVCGKDKWINLIKKLVYKEDIEFTRETIRIMKIGQLAETLILDDYCNSNGIYQMTNKNSNNEDMFYYTNPEFRNLEISPDSFLLVDNKLVLGEIKYSASCNLASEWNNFYKYKRTKNEFIIGYYLQCQAQMSVLNLDEAYLIVCLGNGNILDFKIKRDEDVVKIIKIALDLFYIRFDNVLAYKEDIANYENNKIMNLNVLDSYIKDKSLESLYKSKFKELIIGELSFNNIEIDNDVLLELKNNMEEYKKAKNSSSEFLKSSEVYKREMEAKNNFVSSYNNLINTYKDLDNNIYKSNEIIFEINKKSISYDYRIKFL